MGKTFEFQGKTYNALQINSLSIRKLPRYSAKSVGIGWLLGGLGGLSSVFWLPEQFKLNYGLIAWGIATLVASGFAVYALFLRKYQLVFDMSSGSVTVYTTNNSVNAEQTKELIVKAIQGESQSVSPESE